MKKILVLGGSGFIGRRLCEGLIRAGYQPVVFDRVPPTMHGVEYHLGDMVSLVDLWRPLLEGVEAVFHLAWSTKPQSSNDAIYYDLQTNVLAGVHFLDCLVQIDRAPRLIFASTGGAIYGTPDYLPIDELHPTRPVNAYGIGKQTFERYLSLYRRLHGLDYLVFRPGNPYGEGQDPAGAQGAVAVFLGKMLAYQSIPIWGDGEVIRDYLYVGDLVDAFIRGINFLPKHDEERVFNLGSGIGLSLNQLLSKLSEVTGRKPLIDYQPSRKADSPAVVLDTTLVKRCLDWKPNMPLESGLRLTYEWLLKRESQ
jgi:UDP-glucose 4-epimerase